LFRDRTKDSVRVHLSNDDQNFDKTYESNGNNSEDIMTVQVIGDMPKIVRFEEELTIQV